MLESLSHSSKGLGHPTERRAADSANQPRSSISPAPVNKRRCSISPDRQRASEIAGAQNKTKIIEFWWLLSEICWRTNPEEETYLPPLLCTSHPSIFRSMLCFRLTQSQARLQVGITNNRSTNNKYADLANIFCFTSYDFVFFFWASHCFTSTAIKSLSVL